MQQCSHIESSLNDHYENPRALLREPGGPFTECLLGFSDYDTAPMQESPPSSPRLLEGFFNYSNIPTPEPVPLPPSPSNWTNWGTTESVRSSVSSLSIDSDNTYVEGLEYMTSQRFIGSDNLGEVYLTEDYDASLWRYMNFIQGENYDEE